VAGIIRSMAASAETIPGKKTIAMAINTNGFIFMAPSLNLSSIGFNSPVVNQSLTVSD
jgi:hypothetical protein